MTRPLQKSLERHFVEESARFLGKSWNLGLDREHPDFLVTEGQHQFGLEVCEIFTGQHNRGGSVRKMDQSETQRKINAVRREYEAIEDIPLAVKFVGNLCAENMAKVVPALIERKLSLEPIGRNFVVDVETGLRAGLRLHVGRGFRPDWINVMDRAGWIDRNTIPRITAIVEKKSQQLPRYAKSVGSDIRLLIVANRILNSGKLKLPGNISLEQRGFQEIYFFAYPDAVIAFN